VGLSRLGVEGPCGLGAQVSLGTSGFVPEPGAMMLLGSGVMGLAGYATLRLRSERAVRWRTRE
jgi:hypothetical protein